MPATAIRDYSCKKLEPSSHPEDARVRAVAIEPASEGNTVEYARGTVMGIVTATGKYVAYDDDGTDDGRRVAKALLMYDISVDDAGNITLTDTATEAQDRGETYDSVPVYERGVFNTADLTGLDANAVSDLGRLLWGTTSAGELALI